MGKVTQEELDRCIKNVETGIIYLTLQHNKNPKFCFLRTKNRYYKKTILELKQGLVDGKWSAINEHEYKSWKKEDDAYMEMLSHKLLKRCLLAQLLTETDDDLKLHYADDKRLQSVLSRSIKETERIAEKHYNNIYGQNNELVSNIMNGIDDAASSIATFNAHDFLHLNKWAKHYTENREEYANKSVELTKLDK